MSYFSSKHPGLYLYMCLIALSVFSFLYLDTTPTLIGILSVFWGIFTVMRVLSLYEVAEHFKTNHLQSSKHSNHSTSALAHDLTTRMNGRSHFKRGLMALSCMHERTLGWFALACFYVGYQMYIFDPALPKAILVQDITIFLMIGAAFWSGQSYAYSNTASKALLLLFTALFSLSLYEMHEALFATLHLNESLITDNTALWLLVILCCYCITSLLYALTRNIRMIPYVIAGLCLIISMGTLHLFNATNIDASALWLSGWALFSIFWIRAYLPRRTHYTLYQCE